jgi:host factor-I protein
MGRPAVIELERPLLKGSWLKMQKTQKLQDVFLNQARRDRLSVTVFLMNGFQLKGIVRSFDNFTLILDSDGKQQMIYKHAISTMIPPKPIDIKEVT